MILIEFSFKQLGSSENQVSPKTKKTTRCPTRWARDVAFLNTHNYLHLHQNPPVPRAHLPRADKVNVRVLRRF